MIRLLLIAALTVPLQGCFFIMIPPSISNAAHDAVTGERGENCVGENIKVGDRVTMPSGVLGTVTDLSGKSIRCREADKPIRASVRI